MSVPLHLDFTPDDNVVPKIKCLEQEEPMVPYEWLKKIALESVVTPVPQLLQKLHF